MGQPVQINQSRPEIPYLDQTLTSDLSWLKHKVTDLESRGVQHQAITVEHRLDPAVFFPHSDEEKFFFNFFFQF